MPLRLLCNTTGCEFRFEGESPEELDRALVVHSQRTGHHRATRSVVEVDWKTRAQTAEAAVRGWVGWVEHLEVCPACHGGGAPGCPEAEVLALDLVRLVEPVIGRPILGRPAIAAPAGHQPVDLCLAGELGTSGEPRKGGTV